MEYRLNTCFRLLRAIPLLFLVVSGCSDSSEFSPDPPIYVDPVNGVDELYYTNATEGDDSSNQTGSSGSDEENRRGTNEKPYKTIKFAYDSNPEQNGWVILKEGIYSNESGERFPIRLPKSALLKSQGEATIQGNGDVIFSSQNMRSAFTISQSATIRGIIVKPENETAFTINHSSGTVKLDDVTVDTCKNGVLVSSGSIFEATKLAVRSCSDLGMEIKGRATVRIDSSSFTGNGIGLSIQEQVTFNGFISSYNNFKSNINCDVLIDSTDHFDLTDNNWDAEDGVPEISTICENGADLVVIGGGEVTLFTPVNPIESNTIYISPGADESVSFRLGQSFEPYGSITRAISENPGFTGSFILEVGTFNINTGETFPIVLPDNTHLIGANGVVIQGSGNFNNTTLHEEAAIAITGSATIENIEFDPQRNTAIFINTESDEVRISNIGINNCGYGIKSIANGSLSFENINVNDCLNEGVSISGSGEFLLRNSTLSNNTIGLRVTENARPVAENSVRNNTFSNNFNCDVLLTSQNTFNLLANSWDTLEPEFVTGNSCSNLNTNIVASGDSVVVYLETSNIGTVYVDPVDGDNTPVVNTNEIYQGDQSHPFKTIKGVFDRYPDLRGTISLRAGDYSAGTGEQFPILVPDGVNIEASTSATMTGSGYYEAVGISPRYVTFVLQGESRLDNLTINPAGSDAVVIVNNAGVVELENLSISNCVNGVYSAFNTRLIVNGLSVTGCDGIGLEVSGSTRLSLRNSVLSGNAVGSMFSQSSSLDNDSINTSNEINDNLSCDVYIAVEGEFKLFDNTWDIADEDLLVSSYCGGGNDLVVAENSRVNIQQVSSQPPPFNASLFLQRNSPTDGGLYKESELQFSWSNYQSNIHAIAIWDELPRFANNSVANIGNVVWYWHSGLLGDSSNVMYEYGIQPLNGTISDAGPPSPLTPGKTYYWVVWGWDINSGTIFEVSDIGYFVADPY